jgi:hypothetical protein
MNEKTKENNEALIEFAPEYTVAERKSVAIKGLIAGILVMLVMQEYLIPGVKHFAETAHCREVLGYSGLEVLFYGIFVGIPLLALIANLPLTIQGYKVIKDSQFPPKGVKVFKKTKITKGKKATVMGMFLFLTGPAILLPLMIYGYYAANGLIESTRIKNHKDISVLNCK